MPEFFADHIYHGGDYNPDQWLHVPGVFEDDLRLMKLAGCDLMSVGIFSWVALEPEEGQYAFDWLENVLDRLHESGVSVFLATPTGARPAWMSQKYPEVNRVDERLRRHEHGERHNHCYTSPAYRDFTRRIIEALAKRFGSHPAVIGWHLSNEYGGECFCPLCQDAFRAWLRARYGTLEALNRAWWTGFWSKTYTAWEQISAPSEIGESAVNALRLNWKRFSSHQTHDFMKYEIAAIRKFDQKSPVTTNFHGAFDLDDWKLAESLDFTSYDNYPQWGSAPDSEIAERAALPYDFVRAMKGGKPWALMESTPSITNWMPVCRPKPPGLHLAQCIQAVGHGADTVQYFQWRASLGACEKMHGAVVGHDGGSDTRVFREVQSVSQALKKLSEVAGSAVPARAAVILDRENRWAIEGCAGPRREKAHEEIVSEHYRAMRRAGLAVDVIDSEADFSKYGLISAPMLYMVKPGVADRLTNFVSGGGSLVTTFFSGVADGDDLCFRDFAPGPLSRLTGAVSTESDVMHPGQQNSVLAAGAEHPCGFWCDVLNVRDAKVLGTYEGEWYAGTPALTLRETSRGATWYLAARCGIPSLTELYRQAAKRAGVEPVCAADEGVDVCVRGGKGGRWLFAENFSGRDAGFVSPKGRDLLTGRPVEGHVTLRPYEAAVIRLADSPMARKGTP